MIKTPALHPPLRPLNAPSDWPNDWPKDWPKDWKSQLRQSIRNPEELCRRLELPLSHQKAAQKAAALFSVLVPPLYFSRMEKGNPHDPLLRQVLPLSDEELSKEAFVQDPVGDSLSTRAPGLLHKYAGRALLILTGSCAIHCRYCFRRHYPYDEAPHSPEQWSKTLEELGRDSSIEEIILSGGDPLMCTDHRIKEMLESLSPFEHIKRIRFHTRLPLMIPERITPELVDLLENCRFSVFVVIHSNHAAELGIGKEDPVAIAIAKLVKSGIPVLNQSVLLKGVNDTGETLIALSKRLLELRVIPYYLHQLDRVQGAHHFEVSVERGKELINELRTQLPGYAVPRYVQEIAGESAKSLIA